MVKNSVGSNAFRNLFAITKEGERDILEDGELSCAYFVSSILIVFKLIGSPHVTVSGALKDMLDSDWAEISEPQPGCVVLWKEINYDGGPHKHLGFYVGDNKAVSNDFGERKIIEHAFDHRNREIEKFFWHPKLDPK